MLSIVKNLPSFTETILIRVKYLYDKSKYLDE
jgi:hypothetical protein